MCDSSEIGGSLVAYKQENIKIALKNVRSTPTNAVDGNAIGIYFTFTNIYHKNTL